MEIKLLEIRDSATFIPIMAIRLNPANEEERYLLARAGYGPDPIEQSKYVQLVQISDGRGKSVCDPHDWGDRTYQTAHDYIIEHFAELKSGDVVDVEFILGGTPTKKVSERIPPIEDDGPQYFLSPEQPQSFLEADLKFQKEKRSERLL